MYVRKVNAVRINRRQTFFCLFALVGEGGKENNKRVARSEISVWGHADPSVTVFCNLVPPPFHFASHPKCVDPPQNPRKIRRHFSLRPFPDPKGNKFRLPLSLSLSPLKRGKREGRGKGDDKRKNQLAGTDRTRAFQAWIISCLFPTQHFFFSFFLFAFCFSFGYHGDISLFSHFTCFFGHGLWEMHFCRSSWGRAYLFLIFFLSSLSSSDFCGLGC